jgi:hypothetical protein
MKRRAWIVLALAAITCLAMTATAMAISPVTVTGPRSHYDVPSGRSLTIAGTVAASYLPDWSNQAPVIVQLWTGKVWKDLFVLRMSSAGAYKFTLTKPHDGTYRVQYPGCRHFYPGVKAFTVDGGTAATVAGSVKKLYPYLTITNAGWTVPRGTAKAASSGPLALMPTQVALQFDLGSAQSYDAMCSFNIRYRVYASFTGATYTPTPVYISPSLMGFNSSRARLIAAVPLWAPGETPDMDNWYRYFRIEATWAGNRYTNFGEAVSVVEVRAEK